MQRNGGGAPGTEENSVSQRSMRLKWRPAFPCSFSEEGRKGKGREKMAVVLVVPSPLVRIRGFLRSWWGLLSSQSPPWAPALAVQGPASLLEPREERPESDEMPSFLDNILWMAVPKSRRTIETNRCRRRNPRNLLKAKRNIDQCPRCGRVKLKHVLCGYCYEKVRHETSAIKAQIRVQEGGPHRAPTVETVVLYEGEKPREQDEGKRIVERARKRPSWFALD